MTSHGYGYGPRPQPGHGSVPYTAFPTTWPPRASATPGLPGAGGLLPARHRPWSTILVALHVLAVVGGVVGCLFGLLVLAGSLYVGVMMLVVFGFSTLVAALVLKLLTTGRKRADRALPKRLFWTSVVLAVLGGVGLLSGCAGLVWAAAYNPVTMASNVGTVVVDALYVLAAVRTALACR